MIKPLIEKVLSIPVLEDFNHLTDKVATVEEYMIEPGLIGNGSERTSLIHYKIQLIYNDKEALGADAKKLNSRLGRIEGFSLATTEIVSDREHKKWMAIILLSSEEGERYV